MAIEDRGWVVRPVLHRSKQHEEYANQMSDHIKSLNIPKRPVSKIQASSISQLWDSEKNTLREMSDEEVAAYQNRPLPEKENWKRETDAELIAAQLALTTPSRIHSTIVSEGLRRESKNTQGDAISMGGSAFSEETKELARQAYSYTPPAELTKGQESKLTEMNKITEYTGPIPEKPKPNKRSWLDKLFSSDGAKHAEIHNVSWRDAYKAKND
jgi:hypothetical protein